VDYKAIHKHLDKSDPLNAKYFLLHFVRKSGFFDSFIGKEEFQLLLSREALEVSESDDLLPLIGPEEVAKWLGVSSGWVRDHATRKTPRIPSVKVGKLLRFRPSDVRNFIRNRHSERY
jgi:excisionase family DNA binding protein